jgi:hypothetical protein
MSIIAKVASFCVFLTGLFITALLHTAHAVDYDGDGKDDLEVIRVSKPNASRNKGTTKWSIRYSKTGKIATHSFSVPGDAFIHFRRGDGKVYPGVVWVKDSSLPLYWFVKGQKSETRFPFGSPGDTIPNQRDLDGDGITDPASVRVRGDGSLEWFARMSGSANGVQSTVFGNDGDRVGFGSDGMLFAINSSFVWSGRFFSEATTTFSEQWGSAGDIPLFGNVAGRVAVARSSASSLGFFIRNSDGSSVTQTIKNASSAVPLLGNFTAGALGVGWFNRSKGYAYLKNLSSGRVSKIKMGSSRTHIMLPTGQVITTGSTGAFGTSAGGDSNSGAGSDGSGGSVPTNPGLQSVCPTVRALHSAEIWKAIASTHIPASDPRRYSTSFIVRSGNQAPSDNCIPVYDSRGNQVHALGQYFPTGSAYSSRHYGGSGCGDKKGPDAIYSAATGNTGSSEIYLKVQSGECVKIPNPKGCYNSSQC